MIKLKFKSNKLWHLVFSITPLLKRLGIGYITTSSEDYHYWRFYMKTIKEALEETITENCQTCQHNDNEICDITEEKIGSGDEYCGLVFIDRNKKDGIY